MTSGVFLTDYHAVIREGLKADLQAVRSHRKDYTHCQKFLPFYPSP
jgi:hypothetical protein